MFYLINAFYDFLADTQTLMLAGGAVLLIVALLFVSIMLAKSYAKEKAEAKDTALPVETESVEDEPVDAKPAETPEPIKKETEEKATEPAKEKAEEIAEPVEEKPVAKEATEPEESVAEEPESKPAAEEKEKSAVKKSAAKKPAVKKAAEKKDAPIEQPEEKPAEKPVAKKKATGKWIIEIKKEGEYMSKLSAMNGEVMLSSEIYTTEDGARNGIETISKAIETGDFIIYQDKSKAYYYKLKNAANRFLCAGEIYKTKDQCLKAVESVKRIYKDAIIVDELVEGDKYIDYVPEKDPKYEVKKGFEGKWKIEQDDDGRYFAKLYASNGQVMLGTEGVASKKTAITAMENVKKYAADGNFVIDRDKFGRFYFKLRNAQKSVVCIGEAYDSLDNCVSALEKTRKYAAVAILAEDKKPEAKETEPAAAKPKTAKK